MDPAAAAAAGLDPDAELLGLRTTLLHENEAQVTGGFSATRAGNGAALPACTHAGRTGAGVACACAPAHACTHACAHASMQARGCVHTQGPHARVHAHMHTCTCAHACLHACMHACMHARMHAHGLHGRPASAHLHERVRLPGSTGAPPPNLTMGPLSVFACVRRGVARLPRTAADSMPPSPPAQASASTRTQGSCC